MYVDSDRVNPGPGVNKDVRGQQGQTENRWVIDENHREWYTPDFEIFSIILLELRHYNSIL